MTRPASLGAMPLDILCMVCECLVDCDLSKKSLFSFSLTSKWCNIAATRQRFRRVPISLESKEKLADDIERWNHILIPRGYIDYVQVVKITGSIHTRDMAFDSGEWPLGEMSLGYHEADDENDDNEWAAGYDDQRDSDSTWEYGDRKVYSDVTIFGENPYLTNEERQSQEVVWSPLVHFVKSLSGLKDLIYASEEQIPLCVLLALHQYHPKSRLHMHHFILHSLFQPADNPRDISLEEYTLATSPCLYSIRAHQSDYDIQGRVCYNTEAILQMVAGLAPNLRHVSMAVPSTFINTQHNSKPAWRGFFINSPPEQNTPRPLGQLRSLSFKFIESLTPSTLRKWTRYTDFSKLQTLRIMSDDGIDIVRILNQMAVEGKFSSLRSLNLKLFLSAYADTIIFDRIMADFLRNLPPLKELKLTGFVAEQTFNVILEKHGNTLLKLDFIPSRGFMTGASLFVLFNSEVKEIQKQCPNLQTLGILIPRTNGNKDEVDIYRTLGMLKWLKQLILRLDFSSVIHYRHSSSTDPGTDSLCLSANAVATLDQMRETFKNCAIDANLALSIFRMIAITNGLRYPSKSPSLQYLKLQPWGHGEFGSGVFNGELGDITRWIGRSWLCTRPYEDVNFEEVVTREVDKKWRMLFEHRIEDIFAWGKHFFEQSEQARFYQKVWKSIWPGHTDGRKWTDDWSSCPLLEE